MSLAIPLAAPVRRGAVPLLVVAALGTAAAVGGLAGLLGVLGVGAVLAVVAVLVVAWRPEIGAYLFIGLTPLVVGIDRGVLFPLVRPNEALLGLLVAGLVLRGLVHVAQGRPLRVNVTPIDWVVLALAVTSSVVPLLWMYARERAIEVDDLFYALTMWKYLAVFVFVRYAIRTERQVRTALWLALAAGVVVAVVAVLQSLQVLGVPQLLTAWYAPLDDTEALSIGRGTSTLSSSIAVGDMMGFLVAITIGWWSREPRLRPVLALLAGVYVVGALGSGQFSGVFALVIAAVAAAALTGQLGRLFLAGVPLVVVAGFALQPVIGTRLSGFESQDGVPPSWTVRFENLETYFWPELMRDFNWTLGVRTSARVPAPEVWRDYVFIESGHTWLLWNGGIPLLVAFVVYVVLALRTVTPIARRRGDAIGVAAVGAASMLWVITFLMLFDPHLTLRGTADLAFPLLALALTAWRRGPRDDEPEPRERPMEVVA